ncbi:caspase domain-containing protein [Russula earlei]|uniref:Caspase domain-containing protein n=1 Tax=Russula earlei TaxID=71964 RepID=A0ACC0UIY8_9AGAM|nr:caspase domain-containing protein [Russula earlei]
MGARLSFLRSRLISVWSRWWHRWYRAGNDSTPKPKRRALLVGISYRLRRSKKWTPLDGTHIDVKHFRELLINTYGYSPEDITVLMDDPTLPGLSQPTRANMICELRRLVAAAAPGDTFVFLYSGHSDQQPSLDDPMDEEDGQDEVIITCDLKRIIDNELKYILVKDLPVGSTLTALLDTCHSGTMLDLPHYYCNNVYVPWLSKGDRRTKTMQNKIVRGHAFDFVGFPDSATRRFTTIASVMSGHQLDDTPSGSPLRIDTDISPAKVDGHDTRGLRGCAPFLSPTRYDSPVSNMRCDGWCAYEDFSHPTAVSLSACADLQCAWEGPRGSLTAVLCDFLKINPSPSYRTLMSHVNFQIHANCRALHEYTLREKKKAARGEGPGFDGELNNFQAPQLSSLTKLNMDDIFRL